MRAEYAHWAEVYGLNLTIERGKNEILIQNLELLMVIG